MSDLKPIPENDSKSILVAASRKTFFHAVLAAAVLATGVVTVRGLEKAMNAVFDKPPAPLQKSLDLMSKTIGNPVRYEGLQDQVLDEHTVQALGTADYLVREYRDKTLDESAPGAFLNLNLNYYPTGSSTPHVPEICWAGSGRDEVSDSRDVFDVKGVKRADGSLIDLRVRMISFKPTRQDENRLALLSSSSSEAVYTNVAYVFHVNGTYVSNPQEVISQFWKATNRYAYHAKIEITPMRHLPGAPNDTPLVCTKSEARRMISDFLRSALPEVEACLPDPVILTQAVKPSEPGPGPATTTTEMK